LSSACPKRSEDSARGPVVSPLLAAGHDEAGAQPRHANEVMMVRDYNVKQLEQTIMEALELAADWGRAYRKASPQVRRQINQAFYKCFLIDSGGVAGAVITDDFAGMLTEDLVRRFERQAKPLPEPVGQAVKALPAPRYKRRPSPIFSGVGSSKSSLVDLRGIEPLTSCLPSKRSTI
jgi:hypothetical protein